MTNILTNPSSNNKGVSIDKLHNCSVAKKELFNFLNVTKCCRSATNLYHTMHCNLKGRTTSLILLDVLGKCSSVNWCKRCNEPKFTILPDCAKCKQGFYIVRSGPYGEFYSCSRCNSKLSKKQYYKTYK